MVDYANENDVSVIMIAGDMFDKPQIRKSAKIRVLEEIRIHSCIDFLYLRGNHDNADFFSDLEEEDFPKNLKLFNDKDWTSYEYSLGIKKLKISGRELTDENSMTLAANLVLDSADLNIVMLHGQEREGNIKVPENELIKLNDFKNKNIDYLALGHIHSYRRERLDDRGIYCYSGCLEGRGFDECGEKGFVLLEVNDKKGINDTFIPFSYRKLHTIDIEIDKDTTIREIKEKMEESVKNIDYLALGHIHSYRRERLDDRGIYCYSGCLEGRGFDECGEKGFVLLEVNDKKGINDTFIPFSYRKLHTIDIEIDKDTTIREIKEKMEESVKNISNKDLIKFILKGKTTLDISDSTVEAIKNDFSDRFYFVKIYNETSVYINYEDYKNDRSLKGEFVRLVQKENLKNEKDRNEIVEMGIKAILGEDVF